MYPRHVTYAACVLARQGFPMARIAEIFGAFAREIRAIHGAAQGFYRDILS
jgi:hypothetical protein